MAQAAGLPIVEGISAAAVPTWRAAYSDRTAAVMARFCELAYQSAALPTQTPPGRATVAASTAQTRSALESGLAAIGFTLAAVFSHRSTQAYLAVSPQFAVLAFRGTQQLDDWGINVDALMADLHLPGGRGTVRAHEGFLNAYQGCAAVIGAALTAHVGDHLGLYITGHSLGGALAQIASASLERDTLAACYTFGSPRVGSLAFDAVVKCPHYRLIDHWDIVPTVPPPFYQGYLHSGDPRYIARGVQAALRRDRDAGAKVVTNLIGLSNLLVFRRAKIVDDHMIGRYRAILENIAGARQTSTGSAAQTRGKPAPKEAWAAAALGVGLLIGFRLRRRPR